MQINYTLDAFISLTGIVNFVESKNTLGAGIRWLNKFEIYLKQTLPDPSSIKLCNNKVFNQFYLRCINFNDWVIAYSVQNDVVTIEAILHRSRLID